MTSSTPPIVPTPEQQEVIDHPLRSFRVAAGAGTGKTTTVALRVAGLVADLGIDPERILGITFTNKAAGELAERIGSHLAGVVEPGREVEVHTYHGWAAQLLVEFGALVGIERDMKLVTPVFARQMLSDLVLAADLRTTSLASTHDIDRVTTLAGQLADNLLSTADVPVPADPDDIWAKRIDILSLLRLFEDEKRRLRVADHGDLIVAAHRLVTRHPEIGSSVAERYSAVVLDEYQDTNPAQRELLRAVFGGRVPVTAVGDADQTIYEWRGASLLNFDAFGEHFPNDDGPAPSFPLTTNRRSGPEILAVANRIRRSVSPDARELVPVDGADGATVTTAWLGTSAAEADWIAGEIERHHDDGTAWRDQAVLFRKNKDMLMVHDALSRRDIPFEVANLGGLLSVPEVADLWCWLRLLAHPEDSTALTRLLVGSRFRLGLADLARLADWVRGRRHEIDDDIEGLPDYTLVESLDHLDEVADLRPGARTALTRFHREHRRFLEGAQGLSLVELCRTILDETGAWQDVDAMSAAAGLSARLNLFRFLDLAERWSPLEGRPSLGAFVAHLALMHENPREEVDTARLSDADAVTLITIHRAKGLEWDVVFLPAMYGGNFPSGWRGGDDPYRTAEVLPHELRLDRDALPELSPDMDLEDRKDLLRDRHAAAENRLAYVAVTRARRHLLASGAWWYGHPEPNKTPARRSALFDVIDELAVRVADVPAPDRPGRADNRPEAPPPDPGLEDGWAGLLRAEIAAPGTQARSIADDRGITPAYDAAVHQNQERLFALPEPPTPVVDDEVATSATGLVTYATCPLRYRWTWVEPLPRRPSAAARRGTDIHRRIELHNVGVVPLTDGADVTDRDEDDGAAPGVGIDPFAVFLSSRYAEQPPMLTEMPFDLRADAGRVRGRIDAVYDWGGHWEVVDFKSGRPRRDGPNLVQLQAYAVAMDEIDVGTERPDRLSVSFVYLGAGEPSVTSHDADDAWLAEARDRVDSILGRIGAEDWEPTPSDACRRCDFLRFCPTGTAWLEP